MSQIVIERSVFLSDITTNKQIFNVKKISFSCREIDVISCLLSGRTAKSIALILSLSPKTVETHVRNILQKTMCHSKEEIINLIENSEAYNLYKTHYLNILRPYDKYTLLIKLFNKIRNKSYCVLLCCDGGKTKSIFEILKNDFNVLGWEVIEGKAASEVKLSKPIDLVICINTLTEEDKTGIYSLSFEMRKLTNTKLVFSDIPEPVSYEVLILLVLSNILNDTASTNTINSFVKKHNSSFENLVYKNQNCKKSVPAYFKNKNNARYYIFVIIFFLVGLLAFFPFKRHVTQKTSNLYLMPQNKILKRPQEVQSLENIFQKHKDPYQNPLAVIVGIGGIGKTTLARISAQSMGSSVIWELNAKNKKTLIDSFENLASSLVTSDSENQRILSRIINEKKGYEKNTRLITFIKKLLKKNKQWVLIYDNLDVDFGVIQEFLMIDKEVCGEGKMIITTRNDNIKMSVAIENSINLSKLSDVEKGVLFKKIWGANVPKKNNLAGLLKKIPPYPLDVSIAANYVKLGNLSPEQYTQRIKNSKFNMEKVKKRILSNMGSYTETRKEIVFLAIKQILQINPKFTEVLYFISLIDGKNIPRKIFDEKYSQGMVDEFIYHLKKNSFITDTSCKESNMFFSIHESIQDIISYYFSTNQKPPLKPLIQSLIRFMKPICNSYYEKNIKMIKVLINHSALLLNKKILLTENDKGQLLSILGRGYALIGKSEKAVPLLKNSIDILVRQNSYQQLPNTYWVLGVSYLLSGRFLLAKKTLLEALKVFESAKLLDTKEYCGVLTHLGNAYIFLGKYKEALKIIKKAISIGEKIQDRYIVMFARGALGFLQNEMGETRDAEKNLEEVLKYYKNNNYKYQQRWIYGNLGYSKIMNGKVKEALECLKVSYQDYVENFGPKYMHTGWVASLLGLAYAYAHNPLESKRYLNLGYEVYKDCYGDEHPETAIVLQYMAVRELIFNNKEEAKILLKQSDNIYKLSSIQKGRLSREYIQGLIT